MSKIQELHQQAMDLAEQADLKKLNGDVTQAKAFLRQALILEAEAAQLIAEDMAAEPTRSVLHRSAATLAIECGELQMAEKLIAVAIAGTPPLDIAEELKDLFIQINLRKYLERRGVHLAEDQLQLLAC
ncbi:hypothetical protein N836_21300 [Leptolyngbya sp. Heron Island J]|uniref:hypothetical protein n=1 Tax=Leptolyngbya sp. Heron Island J TaxID=1385935 RepID=UPI0003B9AC42|nr:hypothetical protein [Leptolyngbya sp. Heron Island J]ESA33436.1 hypothetical protein N836_21300 [Leptolyngbya sp. Heron Island J]